MSNSKTEYELISSKLFDKISPLYEIFPWDDLYNDTTHGSRELDSLVNEAQNYGTPDEAEIIREYTEAMRAESKIAVSDSSSEERWHEKVKAAHVLLEKIEPFVNAVLAYYERVIH